jgi:hypothetical protein
MIGLPAAGEKVKVHAIPGRRVMVQGRWLEIDGEHDKDGREVVWSPELLEQYRAGDFLLHTATVDPAAAEAGAKAAAADQEEAAAKAKLEAKATTPKPAKPAPTPDAAKV